MCAVLIILIYCNLFLTSGGIVQRCSASPLKKGRNQEGKDSLLVIDWKAFP